MNYDKFLTRVVEQQKSLGIEADVVKRFSNVGSLMFCRGGKLAPFFVAAFNFEDRFSTLAYFKPGPRVDYGTGAGGMRRGTLRQETFELHEADTAYANLMTYVAAAAAGAFDAIPRHGVCLGWDSDMVDKHKMIASGGI